VLVNKELNNIKINSKITHIQILCFS
jgi:hypothetical protein